jgi:hypothetical protein
MFGILYLIPILCVGLTNTALIWTALLKVPGMGDYRFGKNNHGWTNSVSKIKLTLHQEE